MKNTTTSPTAGSMDPLALKIGLIIVMAVLTLVFGLLPIKVLKMLRKKSNERRSPSPNLSEKGEEEDAFFTGSRWPSLTLCLLTCFSGGVFLATCFLDLLPEVINKFSEINAKAKVPTDYPVPELITCAGFFLVFFLEELVVHFMQGGHGHSHGPITDSPQSGVVHVHDHKKRNNPESPEENGVKNQNQDEKSSHQPLLKEEENHSVKRRSKVKVPTLVLSPGRDDESTVLDSASNNHRLNGAVASKGTEKTDPSYKQSTASRASLRSDNDDGPEGSENALKMRLFHDYSGQEEAADEGGREVKKGKKRRGQHQKVRSHTVSAGESLHLCLDRECLTTKARNYGSCSHIQCTSEEVKETAAPQQQLLEVEVVKPRGATDCSVFTNVELAEPERCEGPCDTDEDPPILMTSRPHAHSHGVRSITLLLALSFHSIIEGMAFGLQKDSNDIAMLFLSLIIHKVIVAFAVGLQFARTHAHQLKLVFFSILILAMVSPIGAAIGISVTEAAEDGETKQVVLMIFEGLAAGTFLYVTFFEILIHERDNEHPNLLKLLVLTLGFVLIAGLAALGHGHEQHSHDYTISPDSHLTTEVPHDHPH